MPSSLLLLVSLLLLAKLLLLASLLLLLASRMLTASLIFPVAVLVFRSCGIYPVVVSVPYPFHNVAHTLAVPSFTGVLAIAVSLS